MSKGKFASKHFGKWNATSNNSIHYFYNISTLTTGTKKAMLQIKCNQKLYLALLDRYTILLDAIHAHKTILLPKGFSLTE